ncbi:hypothetical protein [Candidatus Enterovibrio escicola]|uniref:Iron-containing redox enzyme family protein n=2 Tax=Candidatus Enterovibrio escicola TaxID=1927127 RepID=A0A2A5SZH8_9GAMM|nr:hypothetical protein [Candidatus Enterovibrio escacola]PCS21305.1 hypothetical protein BTN49_3195 [Candidatus Enterovibrio escacola]
MYMVHFNKHKLFELVRASTLNEKTYEHMTLSHLEEELGHNRQFKANRDDFGEVFDPVLEVASNWFISQMYTATELKKVALVHLGVATSAVFFYKHIKPVLADSPTKEYFDLHSVLDDEHVRMGYDFIANADLDEGRTLFGIQNKGWTMLMTVMSRIADLTFYANNITNKSKTQQEHHDEVMA